ncbi:MAG: hypothetical protein RPU42_04135 [Candidatus Sedimenticola sp. (ex Thyasira tokunagai)]
MKKRLKELIEWSGWSVPYIAKKTGIPVHSIRAAIYTKTRINQDIIKAVEQLWPQMIYWLITGKTLPKCGQTSPAEEEVKEAKRKLDEAIRNANK